MLFHVYYSLPFLSMDKEEEQDNAFRSQILLTGLSNPCVTISDQVNVSLYHQSCFYLYS